MIMAADGFFNRELKLRIMSALILAPLVLWVTWIGGYSFELFWAVVGLLVFYEFTRMVSTRISFIMHIIAALMLIIVFAVWFSGDPHAAYMMTAVAISVLASWEALFKRSFWIVLAFSYAAIPFIALSELRGENLDGLTAITLLFACVWGADIFAYIFGRLIGGPKLAPKISPKKTWAGFIGSLVGALLLCYLVLLYADKPTGTLFWLVIISIAIISQAGDLFISVIKRKFDIKDTGKIIPGHGGILDRIDGLIPAGVVLWAILKYQTSAIAPNPEIGAILFSL